MRAVLPLLVGLLALSVTTAEAANYTPSGNWNFKGQLSQAGQPVMTGLPTIVNVRSYMGYSAAIDGVTNDTPALSNVLSNAPAYSRVFIPPGGINLSATPLIGALPKIPEPANGSTGAFGAHLGIIIDSPSTFEVKP